MMFRDTPKAWEGLGFLVCRYSDYRLRLSYDDEHNPSLSLYRVRRECGRKIYEHVALIEMTDVLSQVAEISERLKDE